MEIVVKFQKREDSQEDSVEVEKKKSLVKKQIQKI